MRFSLPARLLFTAAVALPSALLHAQMHKVAAPEKVTRAVGVYEWTGDLAKPTAARLIPVSVFIDAQMQDAGTYYARPVPLALESGNIYSLEKAGVPQGTVTLDFARHLQTATGGTEAMTDLGWFGYGTYATMPAPRKAALLKASAVLPKIHSTKGDDDDDRPTFQRNKSTDEENDKDKKKKKSEPAASVTPVADSGDDPDRPHLGKKPADSSTTSTADPQQPTDSGRKTDTQASDPASDTDRPTLKHRDAKQAEADRKKDHGRVAAAGTSLGDDPDRPTIRRGKTAGIGGDPSPQMTGLPADLHQMVAISDPANREPHPFARPWESPDEQAKITAKLAVLARAQLASYNKANGLDTAASAPPAPAARARTTRTGTARHSAAKAAPTDPPAIPLTDEHVAGYTLMYGGLPTFVYSATSPAPATTGTATGARYVTVIAQQLSTGELQPSFSTATDAQHLDRTPWFRLVDVVDPTASNRASILFELRGHSTRQFALYSLASAKAEEQFVTHINE